MGARVLELLRRWTVCPDPDDRGLEERWHENGLPPGGVPCRADEAWQHTLGHDYHGVAWYRRRARLPRKWLGSGQRVWLRFGAVATDCRVWVNGVEVGSHTGDYVPFEFDITEAMGGEERVEIVCRVDEIRGVEPEVWGEKPWGGHITKGFHDVLGLQHSGIWGGVSARVTGPLTIRPNGLRVVPDPDSGEVRVSVELQPHRSSGTVDLLLLEPGTGRQHRASIAVGEAAGAAEAAMQCRDVMRWSPDAPELGSVHAVARTRGVPARDEAGVRFGFRSMRPGGAEGRQILLNGRPLLLRGVLDWGIENEHIAPSPTRDELAERFAALRARGFNCVCLCMVYPPDEFYEAADQAGMLVWQIHPVWKSDMSLELMPEYHRLFDEFLRRDARHPSVVMVSATCEHERFDEELGAWWWERARAALPGVMLQVQTGFLRWSDAARTDAFDEHTYDNTGRWVEYLEDIGEYLEGREPRPFVMGETIIGTSWPDTAGLLERLRDERPWWAPKGLDAFAEFERGIVSRFGEATMTRLREQGDRFALQLRKQQSELLRSRPFVAGWVMNHLGDVSVCQCGFRDDLGRWRFDESQLCPFLGDAALLLTTPNHTVGIGPGPLEAELGVSNFGASAIDEMVSLETRREDGGGASATEVSLAAEPGELRFGSARIEFEPRANGPVRLCIEASGGGMNNAWTRWVFPEPASLEQAVVLAANPPFSETELAPTFEERRYSSGWALDCKRWAPTLPDVEALLPGVARSEIINGDTIVAPIVTTRLTHPILDCLERGARVLLLASKASGSPPTAWANLYAQVPLIIESPDAPSPLGSGESRWVLDTLGLDLNRRSCRAVPVGELGIAEQLDPVVRLVFTHDKGRPEPADQLFFCRVGEGLLGVSTLDHDCVAGQYLLGRAIEFLASDESSATVSARLDVECVRGWSADG